MLLVLIIRIMNLQYDAILEDGDLTEAVLLCLRLLTGGDFLHEVEEATTGVVDGLTLGSDRAGIEVDPVYLALGEAVVGRDLRNRCRCAERCATAGGEEDHRAAGSGQVRAGYEVVTWSIEEVQALRMYRLCIGEDVGNRRLTALLYTTAGFVLEGRDTALLVSRGRVIINHLIVTDEVVLEAVQHMRCLVKDLLIYAPAHQHALGTEHLRNLGEDGGTALCHDHIGYTSDSRVRRDTGQTIGTAALHTEHQLIEADGLTLKLAGIGCELMK